MDDHNANGNGKHGSQSVERLADVLSRVTREGKRLTPEEKVILERAMADYRNGAYTVVDFYQDIAIRHTRKP